MESIGCIEESFLIREAQGGNHVAFEQLVHAYDRAVLRFAIRITGSPNDAQDIYPRDISEGLHEAKWLPVRMLLLLPGSTALLPTSAWITCGRIETVAGIAP